MTMKERLPTTVVKLGGSLLSLDDLTERIEAWIRPRSNLQLLFVVGGGQLVDQLREHAKEFQFDDEFCHWSAIRIMSKTATWFQELFPEMPIVDSPGKLPLRSHVIFDCHSFMKNDSRLPRNWDTTSDSIAAELAADVEAKELCLLKSTFPKTNSMDAWAKEGIVDANFPMFAKPLYRVRLFDLRSDISLWIEGR